ncbi:tyrosine-type recombinase/integrase [Candidatus Stoquefichus sp. SB1]|uniref:tyrosine-type recombinase/integrase n=1 Tax=Candidatus Stoquefichus sp. SB1 TaxID=1658109 RepID=UPI00067F1555|nr:tyrosine-type recombinase/integrase [Candidatus Stoquefichus sp. SB1]
MPKKRKLKRRANGALSITQLKGNRSKPFAIRETVEMSYSQKQKYIAYFETREEAEDFIKLYTLMKKKKINATQANSLDQDLTEQVMQSITPDMLTFKEIFYILFEEKYKFQNNKASVKSWFNKLTDIHNKNINTINLYDLQSIFDNIKEAGLGTGTLSHVKGVTMDIFKYAVKHQYISRDDDYTEFIDISLKGYDKKEDNTDKRKSFTVDEVRNIMKHNTLESKYALLYIFTGCRPNELLEIDTSKIYIDVDCNDDGVKRKISYMITGSKTEAGRDRIVPIHDTIKPIIIDLLEKHPNYLIIKQCDNIVNKYHRDLFEPLMKELNYNKVPYACRHTFVSLAKLYNMDPFARKRIVGHKSNDLTDDVYTDIFINKLYTEINKIKL